MYKLYYHPLNASMAIHFLLEEMGLEYELILVDRKSNQQKSQSYLALNPTGRIPTLLDGDQVIFESMAICLHLLETNSQSPLVLGINSTRRPLFYQWLMYMGSTLQPELMLYFYPDKYISTESEISATAIKIIRSSAEEKIDAMFRYIDSSLTNNEFLLGSNLSACDFFLLMFCIWADEISTPPLTYPSLNRYLRKMTKLESVMEVCRKENHSLDEYK